MYKKIQFKFLFDTATRQGRSVAIIASELETEYLVSQKYQLYYAI